MNIPRGLTYSQVRLVPKHCSTLMHRAEANTSQRAFGTTLEFPLIASPMPDVCNGEMISDMLRFDKEIRTTGIIHRFQSIEDQIKQFQTATVGSCMIPEVVYKVPCAIGITGDYMERSKELYNMGCRVFCMDTSNGFSQREREAILLFRETFNPQEVYLIAGNVADEMGYTFLSEEQLYVDAVRVGVAGGSACNTNQESGVYYPMASAIHWCKVTKDYLELNNKKAPLIIADGGVVTPGDFSVAIALGADFVLAGGIFAGTKEAPGRFIKDESNGNIYKLYRGAASYGVQLDYDGEEPEYNEGAEHLIKYKGKVEKVIKRFRNGLRSSMSYMNAKTLTEFRQNASFVEVV